jgi:hypothetical protein
MPKVQVSCPRCRQPLIAEVEQLFDLGTDPQAKQRFLSGQSNMADCKKCGFQGPLSLPLVYHDPDKELLLTFFPPDLGLPINDQERLIGPYITQIVNKLPAEKRKGYLLRPQNMLTMQTMFDKILEGDGITHEMIEASQKRLNLVQRLLGVSSDDVRTEIIRQEEATMDEAFFSMISRLIEASMASGDQATARALAMMQQAILPLTEVGRRLKADTEEVQAVVKELQEASQKGLTRDIVLDIMIKNHEKVTILTALVSMIRQGMDREFFNLLGKRIEQASDSDKTGLTQMREQVLGLIDTFDKRMREQINHSKLLLEEILRSPNVEQATNERLQDIDEFFAEVLRAELQEARKNGNYERSGRIQAIIEVIQKASEANVPPEYELIEQLISIESETERREVLAKNEESLTSEFLQMLSGLGAQMEGDGQTEVAERIQMVYREALRFSMERKLNQ